MRKAPKPSFHSLGTLYRAIGNEVDAACPSELALLGKQPADWPKASAPEFSKTIERIKAGMTFYCMEDFLWPEGRNATTEKPIFIGRYSRRYRIGLPRLGENGLPTLSEVIWTPRHPGVQPVAIRTYEDAMQYRKAGWLLERRFLPVLTKRWMVRQNLLEKTKVTAEFHRIFRWRHLYYYGDFPSRIAECLVPEIKFLFGVGRDVDSLGANDFFAPPTQKFEHSFRRQVSILQERWEKTGCPPKCDPTEKWVQTSFSDKFPEEEVASGWVSAAQARTFLTAVKAKIKAKTE